MIPCRAPERAVKLLAMSSDVTIVEHDEQQEPRPGQELETRSREVKPGHLPVSEFASGLIGASAPFGRSDFPLPVENLYYEHPEPAPERILEDERHLGPVL